jgi:succinoglycan biosynthesis transport protein ExoP
MDQQSVAPGPRSVVGDQLRAVRRHWRLIALVAVLAVTASLAYSLLRVPEFRSTADVLLSATSYDVQRGNDELTPEEMATQVQVATSRPVANLVREDLRLLETPTLDDLVTVEALGSSRVLRFTARTTHPDEAAEIARSVATSYLAYRQTNTEETLSTVTDALAKRQEQIESALDRLATAGDSGADFADQRRDLESQLGQVTTQLASLDIAVAGGAGGQLLDEPEANTSQIAPRPAVNGVLSLLIGLIAGLALALTRNRFDDVAHDEDGLLPVLGATHVLGRVPRWKLGSSENRPVTVAMPGSRPSQAFQELVARVRFLASGIPEVSGRGAVLMCTSAEADEGKSDVAVNLAVAAAKVGMRVILVDADLRRAANSQPRGLPLSDVGLTDVLTTGQRVGPLLVDGPVSGLSILPAGPVPADPGGLIASARMRPILAALAEQADLVVVDASPNARYADALEVAGVADVTVLVTRIGRSRLSTVRAAAERLQDVGATNLATVVTAAPVGQRFSRSTATPSGSGPAAEAPLPPQGTDVEELTGPTAQSRGPELPLRQSPRR